MPTKTLAIAFGVLAAVWQKPPPPHDQYYIPSDYCSFCPNTARYYLGKDSEACRAACSGADGGQSCSNLDIYPAGAPGTSIMVPYVAKVFPRLDCFGEVDPSYRQSDFALAVGLENTVIADADIDYVYGNRDGKLTLAEFEKYLAHYGFTQHAPCKITPGVALVAVFGKKTGGEVLVTHAAAPPPASKGPMYRFGDGQWWWSQLGTGDTIVHRLDDLSGGYYGDLVGCYAKPN